MLSIYGILYKNMYPPGRYIPDLKDMNPIKAQIYGIWCRPDSLSCDADTFNGIIAKEASGDAERIIAMADRRPIMILADNYVVTDIYFKTLANKLDVTPTHPKCLSSGKLNEEDIKKLITENLWGRRHMAYVVVVGSEKDGVLLLRTIMKTLFNLCDINHEALLALTKTGWTLDVVTGRVRALNNSSTPQLTPSLT